MRRILDLILKPQEGSLKRQAVRAASWTLLGRGCGYGFRLVNSLILTRLLAREDFGLIATSAAVLTLIQLFSDTGVRLAIIQNPRGAEPNFMSVAWCISVVRGFLLFGAAALLTGPAAGFYEKPELTGLLLVMAGSMLVDGFQNPALWLITRRLQAHRWVGMELTTQALAMATTISLALLLRSPWALAIGHTSGAVYRLAASYWIDPFRPRLLWDGNVARELFRFGRFILANTMVAWAALNFDRLCVGKILDMSAMGVYSIGLNLGMMLEMVVIEVFAHSFFPALSALAADRTRVLRAYRRTAALLVAVAAPLLASGAFFSGELVAVLYPEAFHPAGVVMGWICLRGIVRVLSVLQGNVFLALARLGCETLALVGGLVSVVVLLPWLATSHGLWGAGLAMFVSALVICALEATLLVKALGFPALVVLRPLFQAGCTLAAALGLFLGLRPLLGGWLGGLGFFALFLLLGVAISGMIYFVLERGELPFGRHGGTPESARPAAADR